MALGRLVAAQRHRRVRELVDERGDVGRHQQQRDEDRLFDEVVLGRPGRGRREYRRDEQPDRGEHQEGGVRAGDLAAEALGAVLQTAEEHARTEDQQ